MSTVKSITKKNIDVVVSWKINEIYTLNFVNMHENYNIVFNFDFVVDKIMFKNSSIDKKTIDFDKSTKYLKINQLNFDRIFSKYIINSLTIFRNLTSYWKEFLQFAHLKISYLTYVIKKTLKFLNSQICLILFQINLIMTHSIMLL